MEFLSVIIDRVNVTNVFNIIQGRLPTRDTHLQTRVDNDLIAEFMHEASRLARLSRGLANDPGGQGEVLRELRRVGETFFLQFFPEQIQDRLRSSGPAFLFLHVDHGLRHIPWELLHDGNCFFADKFYLGKNISGYWRDVSRSERDRLRMLIIADPTEDLEWARIEGEGLFESLNAEVSPDRLDLQFMSGRRITKLGLLNAIKDRDIIHYAGHLHFSRDQQESGWLLADGKVLRAREIEKAGAIPGLVFSNSCLSSAGDSAVGEPGGAAADDRDGEQGARQNDLAGAFLRTGICNYVGTNWEINDSQRTYDFALHFYRALFEEKSVGEALFEARRHARRVFPVNDLTWANYVLHGNPMARVYRSSNRRTFDASRSVLYARRVLESYPLPIAVEYAAFLDVQDGGEAGKTLSALWRVFENTLLCVSAVVFGNCRYLNIRTQAVTEPHFSSLRNIVDQLYESLHSIRSLHMELAAGRVLECLYLHRDSIEKMIEGREAHMSGRLEPDHIDSYAVTYHFFLDNLLSDLSALGRYQVLYLESEGESALMLNGQEPRSMRLLPAEFDEPQLKRLAEHNRGRVCFYNSSRKVLFSLEGFMEYNPETRALYFPALAPDEAPAGSRIVSAPRARET